MLLFSFAVSIVVLAKISLGLMAVGFLVNALVIWILNIYNEKYEKLTKEGKQKGDDETRFYGELLSGMREIKIFRCWLPCTQSTADLTRHISMYITSRFGTESSAIF